MCFEVVVGKRTPDQSGLAASVQDFTCFYVHSEAALHRDPSQSCFADEVSNGQEATGSDHFLAKLCLPAVCGRAAGFPAVCCSSNATSAHAWCVARTHSIGSTNATWSRTPCPGMRGEKNNCLQLYHTLR